MLRCIEEMKKEFISLRGGNLKKKSLVCKLLYLIVKFLGQFELLLLECALQSFIVENTSCTSIYTHLLSVSFS